MRENDTQAAAAPTTRKSTGRRRKRSNQNGSGQSWEPLGKLLVGSGLVSDEELTSALNDQEESQLPLGEIVVRLGYVSRPALMRMLAAQGNRELELEGGFGSGLFSVIDERHQTIRRTAYQEPEASPAS